MGALERIPADIRKDGGVARMSDPNMILEIKRAVSIPVMAKARIGHGGTGNVVEAVRHARQVQRDIKRLQSMDEDELFNEAKKLGCSYELVKEVATTGSLPVVNFAAGGVATPADACLMMQLGMDGVFVGSGIFKSGNPEQRAKAIVRAVAHYNDPKIIAEVSAGLGMAMVGISDIANDPVNFRSREGGNPDGVPPKRHLTGAT